MRATPIATVLLIVGGTAFAQPANKAITGLEACFQAARLVDSICSNATNGPVQRLDCFQKGQAAHLECLQHVLSAGSAASETPTGTVSPATPAGTVQSEMPSAVSPGVPAGAAPAGSVSPEMPAETVFASEPNGTVSPATPPGTVRSEMPSAVSPGGPAGTAPAASVSPEMPAPTETVFANAPNGTVSPATPPGTVRSEMPSAISPGGPAGTASTKLPAGPVSREMPAGTETVFANVPNGTVSPATPPGTVRPEVPSAVSLGMPADTISTELLARSVSPEIPAGTEAVSANEPNGIGSPKSPAGSVLTEMPTATASPDKPTAAVPPDIPAKTVDVPTEPPDTNWVVSQTTSPVDYSPLITAAIRSTSSEKDALNTLTIRCRQLRTELLLRTEGTWHISRASEVQVQYQINDQSSDGLRWAVSADGKYATYKDDAVGLLRSLPDGARLKIHVFDGPGHDATFQLTGLDAIRKKIAVACKWAPAADKTSSAKR